MFFTVFISFVILLRIGELLLSKRNEKWLIKNGAVEYGNSHYAILVGMHILFFISLILEYITHTVNTYSKIFIGAYFLLIMVKVWIILSLGKFWSTKIYRIPGTQLIKKGPYKYIKHPNYVVVIGEIALIPLAFHLYNTAFIFTILNAIILFIRIKEEDKVLQI